MELTTPVKIDIPGVGTIESADLYLKSEVDEVIAEKDKEIAMLKAVHLDMMMDVARRSTTVRRLRRALYKACANWGREVARRFYFKIVCEKVLINVQPDCVDAEKWDNMERKCRAMADKYKEGK